MRTKLIPTATGAIFGLAAVIFLCFSLFLPSFSFKGLQDPDPDIRAETIMLLCSRNQTSYAIPQLVICLEDSSPIVRSRAIVALNTLGTRAVPTLVRALGSSNLQMRISALQACGCPDPREIRGFSSVDDQTLLPHVLLCCHDRDDSIRENAVQVLPWVCLGAKEETTGVDALCECFSDVNDRVRASASHAIGRIARYTGRQFINHKAIANLHNHLGDTNNDVREETEWALNEINKNNR